MATEQLFVSIIIILVAARVLGEIFQRFKQPPLVGELLAGVIIGPSILGLVVPGPDLRVLSDLAVFFLMFLAGLEMDPREIRRAGKAAIAAGRKINYEGASSVLDFDEFGDVTPDFGVFFIENGQFNRRYVVKI